MAIYRLGGARFKNYTGLLNNVYVVKNGLVNISEAAEPKGSKTIREYYGAQRVSDEDAKLILAGKEPGEKSADKPDEKK